MTTGREKIWLKGGRMFLREGWLEAEDGARYVVRGGELQLADGYLYLNGPLPYEGPERRCGAERRQG